MIVDLVLLAVVAICVFIGWKRGLMLSLISALSLAIALFAGYLLMPVAGAVIEQTSFPEKTEATVYTYIYDSLSAQADQDLAASLEQSTLPTFIKDRIQEDLDDTATAQSIRTLSHSAAEKVADFAVKALAVLCVTVVVFAGLFVVRILWKGLRRMPVIRQLDTAGGVIFGLVEGVLLVNTFMLFMGFLSAGGLWSGLTAGIQESTIGAFFYEHNFLGLLVTLFVK